MMGNKGFTLLETMIALTISSIIVTSVIMVYANVYLSYAKNNQKIEVQENLRFALNKMASEIRQAKKINSVTATTIEYSPAAGNLVYGYRYDSAGMEIEENKSGVLLPLASNISSINFHYDSNNRIVTITVRGEKLFSGVIEMNTRVQLRTQ